VLNAPLHRVKWRLNYTFEHHLTRVLRDTAVRVNILARPSLCV